ncbi:MAG TPA: type II toxin-antitoxin system RelB/DinJ family antitoxin [Allosphingosinicella sp.]|jgi:DNA-damage-inducible protein J
MASNALVQTRINGEVKDQAAAVLATMGLTVSDAVRLMLTRVAHDKALPFEPLRPNADTIAAIQEARRGNLKSYPNFKALLADLDPDD